MEQYIPKAAVIAEIEKIYEEEMAIFEEQCRSSHEPSASPAAVCMRMEHLRSFINNLEVKEVDEKYECPTIQKKDDVSVALRMEYVDEDLKPIAEFILDYAEWNLHKDEWNHPVLEVPLFRVLDALAQRGKPYCCMN